MRKLIFGAALLASATAFAAEQTAKPIDGWISDSACGAKHAGSGAGCVKSCIANGGAKPVFVDDVKKQVWAIDNPDAVAGHYGDHVAIQGTVDNKTSTVHITNVAMAKD